MHKKNLIKRKKRFGYHNNKSCQRHKGKGKKKRKKKENSGMQLVHAMPQ